VKLDNENYILLLTQGHAGDRLGARLAPALKAAFPEVRLVGLGGEGMRNAGVDLIARTDRLSAMGWTGLLPKAPAVLAAILASARYTRRPPPACVIAVDTWQPLKALHRFAPHLVYVPHVCYLPPGPNFIGRTRVHDRAAVARLVPDALAAIASFIWLRPPLTAVLKQ
jgi:lipid-A-disaccharide synthase